MEQGWLKKYFSGLDSRVFKIYGGGVRVVSNSCTSSLYFWILLLLFSHLGYEFQKMRCVMEESTGTANTKGLWFQRNPSCLWARIWKLSNRWPENVSETSALASSEVGLTQGSQDEAGGRKEVVVQVLACRSLPITMHPGLQQKIHHRYCGSSASKLCCSETVVSSRTEIL